MSESTKARGTDELEFLWVRFGGYVGVIVLVVSKHLSHFANRQDNLW